MADNPRYQQSGIGLAHTGMTPAIDPIGSRARAAAYGNIADVLDRMASSAFKTAVEEAERQGMMWGAQNPVTVDQLNAAVAIGNDPLAERSTHFGNAARKVQATVLANNLNAQGVNEMSRIQAEAEVGNITLSQAAEKMDAVSNAYAQTLTQIDPETGIKLRAAMTTHSSSVYKHLAGEEVKKVLAAQKAGIDEFFAKLPKTLETIYLSGDQVGPDGILKTPDDLVQVQRAHAVQAARLTGDASYGTKFDKAVSEARINAYTKLFTQAEYAKDPATALARIEAGDIGGDHKITWERMTEEDKTKVKEQMVKAFAQRYEVISKTEDAAKRQNKKQVDALLLEYLSPGTTGKRKAEIDRQVRGLGIDPQEYKSMFKPADGSGIGPDREAEIADMIDRRLITDFSQLKQIASGEALKRLQVKLRTESNQAEKDAEGILFEAVAGTKSPIAVLNSVQQMEKYQLSNAFKAEVARRRAEGKPFSLSDVAIGLADQYKQKKFDAKVKPQRDKLDDVERQMSAIMGRQITLNSMQDIAEIDKLGGWKGNQKLKDAAISALRTINSPTLIQGQP